MKMFTQDMQEVTNYEVLDIDKLIDSLSAYLCIQQIEKQVSNDVGKLEIWKKNMKPKLMMLRYVIGKTFIYLPKNYQNNFIREASDEVETCLQKQENVYKNIKEIYQIITKEHGRSSLNVLDVFENDIGILEMMLDVNLDLVLCAEELESIFCGVDVILDIYQQESDPDHLYTQMDSKTRLEILLLCSSLSGLIESLIVASKQKDNDDQEVMRQKRTPVGQVDTDEQILNRESRGEAVYKEIWSKAYPKFIELFELIYGNIELVVSTYKEANPTTPTQK